MTEKRKKRRWRMQWRETENFSGREKHFSILFRRVKVRTKFGDTYAGDVSFCDYETITLRLEDDWPVITYLTIAWDDIVEFINYGWGTEWREMEENVHMVKLKKGKKRRRKEP